ncbi:MAG: type II secretion system protein [Verrucomicrobia bacterium]|nr:type II secretion system protein [Verrucomicrobiota bacterium]
MQCRERGFSLVEVLASMLVLCSASVAITAGWRLADYKELAMRLDDRARRVLRECYELQTFAPLENKPFKADGTPNNPALVHGFLYHPRAQPNAPVQNSGNYLDAVPYTISISSDGKSMELRYELPGLGQIRQQSVRQSAGFNPQPLDP